MYEGQIIVGGRGLQTRARPWGGGGGEGVIYDIVGAKVLTILMYT